jgi:hypothetical protein
MRIAGPSGHLAACHYRDALTPAAAPDPAGA